MAATAAAASARRAGCVDIGIRLLPDGFDELDASRNEAAIHAERLAERSDEDLDARTTMLFGAPPVAP